MPIVFQQNINETTRLAIWHLQEPESFFTEQFSDFKKISHPAKRLQHLCGRYLLKQILPEDQPISIEVDAFGKPYLIGSSAQFSISHSGDLVALLFSESSKVGVDLEVVSDKPHRLKNKFLSEAEFDCLVAEMKHPDQAAALGWTVKEAVFKWYGKGQVDFKNHIEIISAKRSDKHCVIECTFSKEAIKHLRLIALLDNHYIVSCLISE